MGYNHELISVQGLLTSLRCRDLFDWQPLVSVVILVRGLCGARKSAMEKRVHILWQSKCVGADEYRLILIRAVRKSVDEGKEAVTLLEDFQLPEEHSRGRLSDSFRLFFVIPPPGQRQHF
jgi:hypothetical protein